MDRRDSSKYYTSSAARQPPVSGSSNDLSAFPGAWPLQDRPKPFTHTQSSSHPHPPLPHRPPMGYNSHQFLAMPEPLQSQDPMWSPPLPALPTQSGYPSYGYPTQATNRNQPTGQWQFPEPQIIRSVSHKSSLYPPSAHSRTRSHSSMGMHPTLETSVSTPNLRHKHSHSDTHGSKAWYEEEELNDGFERSPSITPSILSEEFSQVSLGPAADGLASSDGLERFQNGEGDDNDWAWHLLVTKEARESLPPAEVMRQSAIFDLINGERSYVGDMELVQEVFIGGMRQASPPVLHPSDQLGGFLYEVFWNMDRILSHHQRMLGSLFALQREQHPLLLSVGDLVLDTVLKFQSEYDSYIKHYPIAESVHRRELKSNPRYRAFLEKCSQDPRLGKRDLITFISRPVTRLPRLSLQLTEVKKRTEKLSEVDSVSTRRSRQEDLPDLETIPILVDVLNRFVKSTQPGIEASEGKVRLHALAESVLFKRGEIIEMDFYHENRTLNHSGPVARRQRSDHWSGWTDLEVGLLDNYVLIMKPDARTGRKDVVSRPIPLEYLRLGPFDGPPENRREERSEGGGLLDSLIKPTRPMFPFVISHASSSARRYTLYVNSERERNKWHVAFVDALGVRKVVTDANKWFAVNSINDGFFRMRTALVPGAYAGPFTGKITAAIAFSSGGRNIVAVATPTGIFAGVRGQSNFSKVLALPSVVYMSALQGYNTLMILHSGMLRAYPLDLAARVCQGQAPLRSLEASVDLPAKSDHNGSIVFFRVGIVGGKVLVVYSCKNFLSSTLNALEAGVDHSNNEHQTHKKSTSSFRPYGEAFYVPKEPFDVTLLSKSIAVSTDRSMIVVDPTNLANQPPVFIPDFSAISSQHNSSHSPLAVLKAKSEYAKPIGIVRCGKEELIVIYDEFGCYVTKHAVPTRKCGYVRWETKAVTYAARSPHIILFSPQFVEVRDISTGRLVEVLEGRDFRLVQSEPGGPLLVAMRGKKDDKQGMSDEVVELVATAPLETSRGQGNPEVVDTLWGEWDN